MGDECACTWQKLILPSRTCGEHLEKLMVGYGRGAGSAPLLTYEGESA